MSAFCALNRENVVVAVGVTETEVGVIYPRKGGEGGMDDVVNSAGSERVDRGLMTDYVRLGVAELVNRAAERRDMMKRQSESSNNKMSSVEEGVAIASALSLSLCIINRFMVASHAGVSALSDATTTYQRKDDEGVLALMGTGSQSSVQEPTQKSLLTPRTLIIQASPDRTSDYNALMNCAFAAHKQNVVIDGCFIPSDRKEDPTSSPYLEQIVHQTSGNASNGIYLSVPKGPAQVNGALSEVLLSVFLPPVHMRKDMNLPKLTKVDFRARCFETGECIDIGKVCNQCLSIFKERPKERCWTCGAKVRLKKISDENGGKRMKLTS